MDWSRNSHGVGLHRLIDIFAAVVGLLRRRCNHGYARYPECIDAHRLRLVAGHQAAASCATRHARTDGGNVGTGKGSGECF